MGEMSANSLMCKDTQATVSSCKKFIQATEKVCKVVSVFCETTRDTKNLGANIDAAMPIVQSLQKSIDEVYDILDSDVRLMSGYLQEILDESETDIDLDA